MWSYREAFRLFSILVFMVNYVMFSTHMHLFFCIYIFALYFLHCFINFQLTWNNFVHVRYVSSIDIGDVVNIQEDNGENITDFPKTIIFIDQNGKVKKNI